MEIKRQGENFKDGPYAVSGGLPLVKEVIISDENGDSVGYERKDAIECANNYALCRCGSSKQANFATDPMRESVSTAPKPRTRKYTQKVRYCFRSGD